MTAGFVRFLFPSLFLLALSNCSYEVKKTQQSAEDLLVGSKTSSLSYATLQQAVFIPKCTVCHGSLGGVNLESYENVLRHLDAIKRTTLESKTMPRGGSLTSYELTLLQKWIDAGAPLEAAAGNPVPPQVPQPTATPTVGPKPGPVGEVSYRNVNARVFAVSCVKCHNSQIASGGVKLDSYADVKANLREVIKSALVTKTMPQGSSLNKAQTDLLVAWVSEGAPEASSSGGATPAPSATPVPTVTPTPEPLEATFESIQKNILTVRCIACHNLTGSVRHIPLVTREDLLNSPRELVIPGNADESGLVLAIEREDDKRMPPASTGQALSENERQIIREWITNGAN